MATGFVGESHHWRLRRVTFNELHAASRHYQLTVSNLPLQKLLWVNSKEIP